MAGRLFEIGLLKFPPCAVPYMEHFNLLLFLEDAIYHAIDVRLVAVQQVSEVGSLACYRAAMRLFLQAKNGLPEASVPFQCCMGFVGRR